MSYISIQNLSSYILVLSLFNNLLCFQVPVDLNLYEKSVYSQNGEDGIIEKIFELIGTTNKYYVEFGVENGMQCNTRYLREKNGWVGLLMDGGFENKPINLNKEFITAENIHDLFSKYKVPSEFDLLSVDIDFNDFYVWKKISSDYRPRVVIIEYNSVMGPNKDLVVPYSPSHRWDLSTYFGSSLTACYKLGRSLGYSLVCTDKRGVNAFFVRDDIIEKSKVSFLDVNNVTNLYHPSFYCKGCPINPRPYTSAQDILKLDDKFDVTVFGYASFADALARLPITFIDCLKDNLKINYVNSAALEINYTNIDKSVTKLMKDTDKTAGNVCLYVCLLWTIEGTPAPRMPDSKVKIAYSMLETTEIPNEWVSTLNKYFDAVVVPDEFLVEVYHNSGVNIPVFVLPCPLYLEKFLSRPLKTKGNKPFTFGITAGFWERKNHALLIDAFEEVFGNNPDVVLKIHGRGGEIGIIDSLKSKIQSKAIPNIQFINASLTEEEYVGFLTSLDALVALSKGEGFSIPPREALAAGIPVILSNNTAHKTICDKNFALPVDTNIRERAFYSVFNSYAGYQFNCTKQDVKQALLSMFSNYKNYLKNAAEAREWVKQYDYKHLAPLYVSLLKPRKVILSDTNKITPDCVITSSKGLYEKLSSISKE